MEEMTLDELLERLGELRDSDEAGRLPVRVAWQPTYPLFGSVVAVVVSELGPDESPETGDNAVYLAGGNESAGYLPEAIAQRLRNEGWQ